MSRYQDDTQETAVISDSVWVGLKSVTETVGKIADALIFTLLVLHTDLAAASDEAFDAASHVTIEHGVLSDQMADTLRVPGLVIERGAIKDKPIEHLRVLHTDSAAVFDTVVDAQRPVIIEHGQLADTVIGQRYAANLVAEHGQLHDAAPQAAKVLVTETAVGVDTVPDHLHAKVLIVDSAALSETFDDAHQAIDPVLIETAHITSSAFGSLAAADLVQELAVIEDSTPGDFGDFGQAWTANTDTWAMSRYAPYTFNDIAVIDGVIYGMTDSGVFALDGGTAPIAGRIDTGKVDLSGKNGELVHPLQANIEYETDGIAAMDVTTTQSGAPETYTYALPAELATSLTNGRFVFGKGLRGRHFKFSLRLEGHSGYINDLRILTAPTKRRV